MGWPVKCLPSPPMLSACGQNISYTRWKSNIFHSKSILDEYVSDPHHHPEHPSVGEDMGRKPISPSRAMHGDDDSRLRSQRRTGWPETRVWWWRQSGGEVEIHARFDGGGDDEGWECTTPTIHPQLPLAFPKLPSTPGKTSGLPQKHHLARIFEVYESDYKTSPGIGRALRSS